MSFPRKPIINDAFLYSKKLYKWDGNSWNRVNYIRTPYRGANIINAFLLTDNNIAYSDFTPSVLAPYVTVDWLNAISSANVAESGIVTYFTTERAVSAFTAGAGINIDANGRITASDTIASNASLNAGLNSFSASIIPSLDNTFNLGSSTKRWKNLYQTANALYIGDSRMYFQGGIVNVADLNISNINQANANVLTLSHEGIFKDQGSLLTPRPIIYKINYSDNNFITSSATFISNSTTGYFNILGYFPTNVTNVFLSNAALNVYSANTVSYNSNSRVHVTLDDGIRAGKYHVTLVDQNGYTAMSFHSLILGQSPTWLTAANIVWDTPSGNIFETIRANSTLSAVSDSNIISYTIVSGSLPSNVTLYSSNGLITGTPLTTNTTDNYNFTVRAMDSEYQNTNSTFTITVYPEIVAWIDPANSYTINANANDYVSINLLANASLYPNSIVYGANTLPYGLTLSGNVISGYLPNVVYANTITSNVVAVATTTNSVNVINIIFNIDAIGQPLTPSEIEFTTIGSYSWVAPARVASVSVVAVGGGAGGLCFIDPGSAGGDSYFISATCVKGGGAPASSGSFGPAVGGTYVGDGGGNGGGTNQSQIYSSGGGGAGGYGGPGGQGGGCNSSGTSGTCGGGGGGSYGNPWGYGGGGVGICGIGPNGAGSPSNSGTGGGGGSGGTSGGARCGGLYGGGGGSGCVPGPQVRFVGGSGGGLGWKNNIPITAGNTYTVVVGAGGCTVAGDQPIVYAGNGAVRIVWGTGRCYPNVNLSPTPCTLCIW